MQKFLALALSILFIPSVVLASTWSPTALVNTESFQIIDEGDGSTNVQLQFGDTINEQLLWDISGSRFSFSDDLHATGNITTDGNLTINEDNGGADAVLTFGNDAAAETLTFSDTSNNFEFSDDIDITGGLTATKNLAFDSDTAFAGTLDHSISAIRTWTLPDATTNLIGTDTTDTLTNKTIDVNSNTILNITGALIWYVDGDLATGDEQSVTFTMPFAFTVTDLEMHVATAPTGANIDIDIEEAGITIFSTLGTIAAGATTENGSHAFSDTTLAKGAEIRLNIDTVGSSVAGSSLTVQLMGTYDM